MAEKPKPPASEVSPFTVAALVNGNEVNPSSSMKRAGEFVAKSLKAPSKTKPSEADK